METKIIMNKESFISKSHKIHGDKYDYSKVEYINNYTKVCIICPEHGEFWQTPNAHLNGNGCPYCKADAVGKRCSHSTEHFIELAKKVHGNRYDYSKVEYANNYTKVCIICPEHGEFWQKPTMHLQGCGCQICNESKLELEIRDFLIKQNIVFEEKKRFDWLGKQHLDFYLPKYNSAIECQGEQHFRKIDFFGGTDSFLVRIKLDETKNLLCKDKVKLYYYTSRNFLKDKETLPKIYNENVFTNKKQLIQKIKG